MTYAGRRTTSCYSIIVELPIPLSVRSARTKFASFTSAILRLPMIPSDPVLRMYSNMLRSLLVESMIVMKYLRR